MQAILGGADRLARAAFALSAVLVMCLAVFVFYEVVARYAVGRPTTWVNEVSGYLLVAATFLAGGWVLRQGAHVRMEMLEEMTGPRGRALLGLFGNLVAFLVGVALVWTGALMTYDSWDFGWESPTILATPLWLPQAAIPVGALVLSLSALAGMLEALARLSGRAPDGRAQGGKAGEGGR